MFTPTRTSLLASPNLRFARHYAEMVVVMLAGMFVLGALAAPVVSFSELLEDAPGAALAQMAFNMTAPMVVWMRFRGHGWPATLEMAGSMIVPTLLAGALLAAGVVTNGHALMGIQHMIMFPAMLAVMLWRREEYSH